MDRNDINRPRFARSIREALEGLELEALCYSWLDDPEYLEITKYLERRLQTLDDGEPKPLTLEELYYMPCGSHIWVKTRQSYIHDGQVEPSDHYVSHSAITGYVDDQGLVAIWSAASDERLLERDYGKTWWAYLFDPLPEDEEQ